MDLPHVSAMMSDPSPFTTMVIGHDCRVVMGPCRDQSLLSIVGLVPDSMRPRLLASTPPDVPSYRQDERRSVQNVVDRSW